MWVCMYTHNLINKPYVRRMFVMWMLLCRQLEKKKTFFFDECRHTFTMLVVFSELQTFVVILVVVVFFIIIFIIMNNAATSLFALQTRLLSICSPYVSCMLRLFKSSYACLGDHLIYLYSTQTSSYVLCALYNEATSHFIVIQIKS